MASQLGHDSPLGAFHNLGHRVQRRSLGASSLTILDLKTFYPYGFPAIAPERSVSEAQPSSSDDNTVARQIDTSAPFRTSLQRYFKPETSASLKGETAVSNRATAPTANVETTLSQNTELISEKHTLQRSTIEDISEPASDSFQLSGTDTADIVGSIQNKQPSPSTSQILVDNHSEIQRTTDLTNGQIDRLPIDSPIVESNTPALTQQPSAASININDSIQSLRAPFASVQRSDEQLTQSVAQSSNANIQPDSSSKLLVPSSTSPSLDAHPALQPDPPVQRLHESTDGSADGSASLSPPSQNLAATSALEPDPTLQRQSDSTAAAIAAHPATPQTEAIQRVTEQNNTASEPLSSSEDFSYQPSTHNSSDSVSTGPLTGSMQNSQQPEPVSGQLDLSPKIQAKPNQTLFSYSSSNSSPAQQQSNLASENFGSNQPSISSDQIEAKQGIAKKPDSQKQTINEQAAIAPTPSTTAQTSSHTEIQRFPNLSGPDISPKRTDRSPSVPTEPSSATEPLTVDSLSIQSGDSAHQEIQRTADTAQLTESTISTTNQTQIAPVPDVRSPVKVTSSIVQPDAQSPAKVTSPIVPSMTAADPSIASVSIQRAAVTQPAQSAFSVSLSEQVNPLADVQRASEAALPLAQSRLTSENLDQVQQPTNITSEDSVNAVTNPVATNIAGLAQRMAESSISETPISETSIPNLSDTSGQNFDNNQQTTEAAAQAIGKVPPQSVNSVPPVSKSNGNGESSEIADSVQRSSGGIGEEQNTVERLSSQERTNAIAPSSSTNQISSNIEIQRSSNLSGPDTGSKEHNSLSSPPIPQPSSETESITPDPINEEPTAAANNLIQRETIDSFTVDPDNVQSAINSNTESVSQSTVELLQSSNDLSSGSTSESHQSQSTSSIPDTVQRAVNHSSLAHKTLGPSSRNPLPVLQPLGVLQPLPSSLKIDKPVSPSSASSQSQSGTIQRQVIPREGANLESLVTGLANSQQESSITQQNTQKPNGTELRLVGGAAKIQRQPSETDSSIPQHADSIPSEWSNLEDLVTHLQKSNTSNHAAAKTASSDQPSGSQSTVKAPPPKQTTQPVKLDKPANVTVQRQITNPPPATKPTIIQACKDTSSNTNSANADEQTDEQTADSHNYSQYVELLAQEVYSLLRQRLSLEQERRGPKYPR
ncbi:hypothetical protein IQ260_10115 [Leptolyngbya cf. ectocarpi LEGE 11479]|uniref:Uncharacterized protein n=1 Tax=Leptolyngbya cf. ectocarpi LEGE 11479 TaxID=1828722 RepID=A0A928X356_LEPEC|nr:hypothetical protein [Leptolyngbya ectocarpi]MBE9067010.1 hypothetical protein [Leptolyngbya cf. ectocarpi LEGE 11479]